MIVGFTGTRDGMTPQQKETVANLLEGFNAITVHHGDCVGADEDFNTIALSRGSEVVVHPPTDDRLRAFCNGKGVTVLPEKGYLARNRDIVLASEVLIATPKEEEPQPKGGTWYTVNYAKTTKTPLVIVWPNGVIEKEDWHES